MTQERMKQIEQHARSFGPSNCWTGTSGLLASMIIELIEYIKCIEPGASKPIAGGP